MNTRTKEVLLINRVKIMKLCDYFIVSAPLIAKRILSMEKHKEFKNVGIGNTDAKAANGARMDALLEYLDECNTPGAFDAFLEGIRNCEGQKSFAKALKRDAEDTTGAAGKKPVMKKPKLSTAMKKPKTPTGMSPSINGPFMGTQSAAAGRPPFKPMAKMPPFVPGFGVLNVLGPAVPVVPAKGAKKKIEANPPEGGKRAAGVKPPVKKPVVNASPPPPLPPGLAARLDNIIRGTAAAPATPGTKPAAQATKQTPQANKPAAQANKPATPANKPASQGTVAPSTPSVPSTSAGPTASTGFTPKIPAGSSFKAGLKRSAATPKSKPMTFQEVEIKQRGASRASVFSFLSPAAMVKTIHFNNKSDLFYEGCRTKVSGLWCAKTVQLKGKGKKYVCKDKHENETYNHFPRLYVTFEDGTTHIQTVLYRENVEILSGKTVTEMEAMNDEALKKIFLSVVKKNIPIEVNCKKTGQPGGGWENVANIVIEPEPQLAPPSKRGRPPKTRKETAATGERRSTRKLSVV